MTLKDLSQLYWLRLEIDADQRRLEELAAESQPGAQVLDGMPHARRRTDSTARCAVNMADLRSMIQAKRERCAAMRLELERYIEGIPDSLTRQVFTRRFVDGLTWAQVADAVGGSNTESSVKKICYRYLRSEEQARDGAG